ncbi:MAG: hypothetical protein LBC29_02730 [Propionibacteriaceae bacterium]|jgi:tetratricopeptide (TPR) repeat protein|nr:hypothetical protein [Propionibacteriaceae bacterium]
MARSVDEANSDIARIEHTPFGPARTQAAITEVARVSADGPEQCLAYALNVLISSYVFSSEQEKAYVPFAQLVQWYDTRPDLFDEKDHYDLQWAFKWMVNGLAAFPNVSAERIETAIADMESRFAVDGIGAKTVLRSRYFWTLHRSGLAAAEPYFRKWLTTANDEVFGSECPLCTCNTNVFHRVEAGDWEGALALFDAALNDPENPSRCFQEPAVMASSLMLWLVGRGLPGDDERARSMYRRVREQVDDSPGDFLAPIARCIQFLAVTGHPQETLRYLKKNSQWLVKAESPLERLKFISRVAGALRLLVEYYGLGDTAVQFVEVPANTVAQLYSSLAAEAQSIAAAFDARNGTDTVSQRMRRALAVEPTGRVLDFSIQLDPDTELPERPDFLPPDDQNVFNTLDTLGAPPPDATAASVSFATSGSTPEQEAQAVLDSADDMARRGNISGALSQYLNAATAYRNIGRLQDAGFAYAEAAAHTYNLSDVATAVQLFDKALGILYAVDTPLPYLIPIIDRQLSALLDTGQRSAATALVTDFETRMQAALAEVARKLPPAGRTDDNSSQDGLVQQWLLEAQARGEMLRSRLVAELGDTATAAQLAERAGERLAEFGNINVACEAFRIAGDLLRSIPDDHAVYCYESAMEAAELLRQRERYVAIGDLLVNFLLKRGHEKEANELARRITRW